MARATSLLQGHQERQGAAQQEGGAHSPSGRHLRGKDPALTKHISPGVPSLCGELSPPALCLGGCGLGLTPCTAAGASPGAPLPAGGGPGVLRLVPSPRDGSWCPWGAGALSGGHHHAPAASSTSPLLPRVSWGPSSIRGSAAVVMGERRDAGAGTSPLRAVPSARSPRDARRGVVSGPVTQSGRRAKRLVPAGRRRGRAPANKIRVIHHRFYEDLLIFFNL